jgi:hypothetical protein
MVRRRRQVVAACDVSVRQCDIPSNHIETRVAKDPLKGEHVAAIDKVVVGERVAKRVRRTAPLKPRAGLEAFEDLLDAVERQPGSGLRKEHRLVGLAAASLREIPPDRPS